jgi:hypothetical protein
MRNKMMPQYAQEMLRLPSNACVHDPLPLVLELSRVREPAGAYERGISPAVLGSLNSNLFSVIKPLISWIEYGINGPTQKPHPGY